jgi:hypothetical protein
MIRERAVIAVAVAFIIALSLPSVSAARDREWRQGTLVKITSEAPGAAAPPAEAGPKSRVQRSYYWITSGDFTYVLMNVWSSNPQAFGLHYPKTPLKITPKSTVKIATEGQVAYVMDNSGQQTKCPIVATIAGPPAP